MLARCETKRWGALAALVCLGLPVLADEAPTAVTAQVRSPSRSLHTTVQVAARTDYARSPEGGTLHEALVLRTQLSRASAARAVSPRLLVEYRLRDDGRKFLLVGPLFSYERARWTVAASPFVQRPVGRGDGRWLYWGNVRRQLAHRQSLGLELFGEAETRRLSKWLLAYSANVSSAVSVGLAIGPRLDAGHDLTTRAIVTWRLGRARR